MSFRRLSAFLVYMLVFTGAAKVESQRWHFDPGKGLEGRAYVENVQGQRLAAECGNGGGPAFTLSPPPGDTRADAGEGPLLLFQLNIDGTLYDQSFRCPEGSGVCHSVAVPDSCLTGALQKGQTLRLFFREALVAQFSLTGSGKALGGLSACTGPR
ncbi:hypothetical protein ACSHT0_11910 [Tepidicaulis sp. LMO-SS28]|uniref:hypothetical protein n=1 Tax=Tepidicaulis sp. LMO-SS28 TaxID=3447455 RepID=UPI003EE37FB0